MSQLGSIFDEQTAASGDKGPDVRVRAQVRRHELQAGRAVLVPVPDDVPHEGATVPRRREVGDPPGAVRLHLSPRLVDGATLRLRRQGGEHPRSGVPGDLLIELEVVAGRRSWPWLVVAAIAAAAVVAGALAWWR